MDTVLADQRQHRVFSGGRISEVPVPGTSRHPLLSVAFNRSETRHARHVSVFPDQNRRRRPTPDRRRDRWQAADHQSGYFE